MRTISILVLLALTMAVGQAHAQFAVKRVKCAEANPSGGLPPMYHYNNGPERAIAVQITRDGCRPKGLDGHFRIYVAQNNLASFNSTTMRREGRLPSTAVMQLTSIRNHAFVAFLASSSSFRISGTFDYMYTWLD